MANKLAFVSLCGLVISELINLIKHVKIGLNGHQFINIMLVKNGGKQLLPFIYLRGDKSNGR